jgi:hypothetical protein
MDNTPNEVKDFLELVKALGEAVENSLPEEKYYLEEYLQQKYNIPPMASTTTNAAPTDPNASGSDAVANPASADTTTPANPNPGETPTDPNNPTG